MYGLRCMLGAITGQEDSPDAGCASSCEISETVPRDIQGKKKEISSVLLTNFYLDIYLKEIRKLINNKAFIYKTCMWNRKLGKLADCGFVKL